MKLTAQIKLLPSPEQATRLLDTLKAVNDAAIFAARLGYEHKVYSQASIHRLAYYAIRERLAGS